MDLHYKSLDHPTAPVATTCSSFPAGDVNEFLIGSEEGAVFLGHRHGSRPGLSERFQGHFGPITSVDCHPPADSELSYLFLTSSTDWSVKLWDRRNANGWIRTFETSGDYVYDCKWNPTSPSVFATASGTGKIELWNLSSESEVPVNELQVSNQAINKIGFTNDGKRVVAGDASGALLVCLWEGVNMQGSKFHEVIGGWKNRLNED